MILPEPIFDMGPVSEMIPFRFQRITSRRRCQQS